MIDMSVINVVFGNGLIAMGWLVFAMLGLYGYWLVFLRLARGEASYLEAAGMALVVSVMAFMTFLVTRTSVESNSSFVASYSMLMESVVFAVLCYIRIKEHIRRHRGARGDVVNIGKRSINNAG